MKKRLKKAIQESFDFPEAAHKAEFLREHGVPAEEEIRRHFIPIPLRITAAAAACALAVGLWNIGKDPALRLHNNSDSSIITTYEQGTSDSNISAPDIPVMTTTAVSQSVITITTASEDTSSNNAMTASTAAASAMNDIENQSNNTAPVISQPPKKTNKVPAAATTAANPGTVVSTTVSANSTDEYERSIIMKKVSLFLSGALAANSFIIPAASAEYKLETQQYKNEKPYLEMMDEGKLDTDINKDGKFDLIDCRLLDWYTTREFYEDTVLDITPEIIANIEKIGDYDGDGEISWFDSEVLMHHFMLNNDVSYDYCDPTFYDPDFVPVPLDLGGLTYVANATADYMFAESFFCRMNNISAGYTALEKFIDNGGMDLDVNEDGKVDIKDYLYFSVFAEERPDNIVLPENIRERVREEYFKIPHMETCFHNVRTSIRGFISGYFASHLTLMPEYFENDFYDSIVNGSSEYWPGSSLKQGAIAMGIESDEYEEFRIDEDLFKECLVNYYMDVKNGRAAAPDVNMDGRLDEADIKVSSIFFGDKVMGNTAAESELPENVWNNFANNCDFSGNGTSGDIYDIMIVQVYLYLTDDSALISSSANVNARTFSTGMSADEVYDMLADTDIDRSGDADSDGKMKMNDAVLVMQTISNADTYQLTSKGRFNADVNNTGDGITPNDALGIQKALLGLEP